MTTLTIEGLRSVIRTYDYDDIVESLGSKCDRAPFLSPKAALAVRRIVSSTMENRVVQSSFDGARSLRIVLAQAGSLRRTTLQLALLFFLLELLEFREVEAEEQDLAQELEERARRMATANHFEALSLHWSATDEEVERAYQKITEELATSRAAFRAAPEACKAMHKRVREAYEVLRVETRRKRYRREAYPDLDYDAVKDFLEKKAQALGLREDRRPLRNVEKTLRDIEQSTRKKKSLRIEDLADD
jgi:hypothetical protein